MFDLPRFHSRSLAGASGWCWRCCCLPGVTAAAPAGPAEHHTPAHKPADYSAAVTQLGKLHEEIVGGRARPAGELDVFTELGDVVRWLPELAADSDLPEEPWNRVARTSDELLVLVAQIQAAPRDQRHCVPWQRPNGSSCWAS